MMRRAICLSEPAFALAGQPNTWRFVFTTASAIPAKAKVKFDLQSQGRSCDWQIPEVEARGGKNIIWLELESGKTVKASTVEKQPAQFEFVLPSELETGKSFTICLGTPHQDKTDTHGNRAQTFAERRRAFQLYIDPKGKGDYKDPENFLLDIKGGMLKNICLVAPSKVYKNQRFDIVVRFEDAFGNLTGRCEEGTLIELSYDQLRDNLNWKLFAPETGFISLPNLYLNEPGLYIFKLKNLKTGEVFKSTPIMCHTDENESLYWGQLHNLSLRFNEKDQIESTLRSFRDDASLQFFATSAPEHEEETPNDIWKLISTCIAEFNEEDRFTTIPGITYFGEGGEEGCRQFIFSKDSRQIPRKKDLKSSNFKKIYKAHNPKEFISIPMMTSLKGYSFDFENFHPDYERVVEIYNSWGSHEMIAKDGNEFPLQSSKKKTKIEDIEGTLIRALNKNCRFGFVAGGRDDRAIFANLVDNEFDEYSPGLTAILAESHNRDALFQALYQRRCYATTGERILLSFKIAGQEMGAELSSHSKPGLLFTRFISGYVAGTDEIKKVIIYRNGKPFKTFDKPGTYLDLSFEDDEPYEKHLIKSKQEGHPPFLYYFMKVIQKNEQVAWSSPIWVDYPKQEKKAETPKKIVKKKPT